jgi:phage shock protein PspC (stress-responsive transcriptional regulator)/vacuolar-type H+-ATPase subunit H
MKKIININLSGRVIPIEDAAYEQLQAYIESLRRYFAHEESRDEIINDIESRIAELMSEKVRKGASCITDADVEEIASSMGRPEDFEAEEVSAAGEIPLQGGAPGAGYQQQQHQYQQQSGGQQAEREKAPRGRLYRDTSDKFIGGVCSGIAAYMNVDPAIVRILFAIITFGGFGLGFLAYIIMWIILPPKDLEEYTGKRLFRNPEEKVIGGVASGLAAYFGRSTATVRLIFAAPLILNILFSSLNGFRWNDFDLFWNIGFSSISGTFILIYIVLWIVLPEARTTYQKMEMRGEKVDVNTIRQNVKEGVDNMKERMKGWGDEVKETAQQFSSKAKEFSNTRGREFATEVNQTVRRSGGGIGHAIGVLFKVFFLFIFGTIAFALFIAVIAILFSLPNWWGLNEFLWSSNWQQVYAWGTLVFFMLVPLIAFIVWVVRRIMNARAGGNYLGWTFGALWTLGWVSLILLITSMGRDFSRAQVIDKDLNVMSPAKGKLVVTVSQPEIEYTGNYGWIDGDISGWDFTGDSMRLANIWFDVTASTDSLYHVTVRRSANGRTDEEARLRASEYSYEVLQQDSLLDLANGYSIGKKSKYRIQQVGVLIQVPKGKKIRFDPSVTEKLNIGRVTVNRRNRRNAGFSVDNDYEFSFLTGVDYIMGIDGKLQQDGVKQSSVEPRRGNTSNYRYNSKDTVEPANDPAEDARQQLEEEKKRIREEGERKIKELEEKAKAGKPVTMLKKKKDARMEGDIVGIPSPVSSLVL